MFWRLRPVSTVTAMAPVPAILKVAVSVSVVLEVEPGMVLLAQLPVEFQLLDVVDVQVLLCAFAAGANKNAAIETTNPPVKATIRETGEKFFFMR